MLVLGDAHGSDRAHRRALRATYRESDADVALQVGDLEWYDLPTSTWFVAGNNEDQDVIEALRHGESTPETTNAHLLASDAVELAGLRVAGLSGNYSPTRYDCDRADLSGGRRRHFTHEDVERALDLSGVDVFLTHEAPHGLLVSEDYDVGCTHVDRILEELTPDLCLVGHHHEHAESTFGETHVVCLAPVWEAYYTLDPETLSLTRHPPAEA
ncbi:metallophosphoesterase [Haloplanus sp. GCM10025708]|uniref:metallophosphoesterase family protein n=1 Tax=Haloferacaceae TaxID=1644056 RepID=UPI003609F0C0